ncbi:MAG: ABC transporter ATP-binding protein, partial [Coleofasciculus sp. S288]|nr:ABC transporter ATP-binding protein [Coleofasciculus sp. S288]
MTKPAILHLEGVTKQFEQTTTPAVANVTLTLHQGDLIGLLGPSGCGKTTLLRIVAGFEQPQLGTVVLAGRPVAGSGYWVPPEQRDTGMVFQDYALFPHLSVAENVAFGLKKRKERKTGVSVKENTQEAIALVGLAGLEKRYPHELSGGQQQRVALARALAPRPAMILLDEPLSNLDVQERLRLRQEVRSILKETRTSAIFVTHDQEEA